MSSVEDREVASDPNKAPARLNLNVLNYSLEAPGWFFHCLYGEPAFV